MKNDSGFRFLVGCFVLFSAFWLYRNGWFSAFQANGNQVDSLDIVGLAIQSIISAIDGVGYVAILLVSGAWPAISRVLESLGGLLKPKQQSPTDSSALKNMIQECLTNQEIQDYLAEHKAKNNDK
tara:strand:+ start:128 stop:502 length:375 start_codon:yes stop_codon:yes gene_type:complete